MNSTDTPVDLADPINRQILEISEDRIQGFLRDPLGEIARLSGVDLPVVIERIQAMLRGGTIRRVRQTLLATNLAKGALVAWEIPQEKLDSAFTTLFEDDPFSGHVVTRSTDADSPGSTYKLWTTLKVPQGYAMEKYAEHWRERIGARHFRLMPAKRLFALGVGHMPELRPVVLLSLCGGSPGGQTQASPAPFMLTYVAPARRARSTTSTRGSRSGPISAACRPSTQWRTGRKCPCRTRRP